MDMSISIGRRGRVAALYSGCLWFGARHTDGGRAGVAVDKEAYFCVCCIGFRSLNATVAQPKNCPFGVHTRIELTNINTTSVNSGT